MNYKQQGDITLFKTDELPKDVTPKKGATLALGEVSGHHHTLYDSLEGAAAKSFNPSEEGYGSNAVQLFEDKNKVVYAKVDNVVYLRHQEHKPITVTPGVYRIGIIREVDPFSDEIRAVQD